MASPGPHSQRLGSEAALQSPAPSTTHGHLPVALQGQRGPACHMKTLRLRPRRPRPGAQLAPTLSPMVMKVRESRFRGGLWGGSRPHEPQREAANQPGRGARDPSRPRGRWCSSRQLGSVTEPLLCRMQGVVTRTWPEPHPSISEMGKKGHTAQMCDAWEPPWPPPPGPSS